MKTKAEEKPEEQISRKEALKKAGRYAAFTAVATLLLLSPKAAQADSPTSKPTYRGRNY